MLKIAKKMIATTLGAVMAFSPIISAAPVFAADTYKITFDANGGKFADDKETNEVNVEGVVKNKRKSEMKNMYDSTGERKNNDPLLGLSEDYSFDIAPETITDEGKEYKLLTSDITGKWQVGTMFGLDIVDKDGNSAIDTSKPKEVNDVSLSTAVPLTVKGTKSESGEHEDADNTYYGFRFTSSNVGIQTADEIKIPTRDGYDFKGWAKDKDAKTTIKASAFQANAQTLYAVWEKTDDNNKDDDEQETTPTPTPTTEPDPTQEPEKTYSVNIRVSDKENDSPLANVKLSLGSKEATTDANGIAKYTELSAGDHDILQKSQVEGYEKVTNVGTLTITKDGVYNVTSLLNEIAKVDGVRTFEYQLEKEKDEPVVEPTTYKIIYNLDGGVVSGNPSSYTEDDEFTLKNPTKEGYTFAGWTGTGLSAASKSVMVTKNSTGDRTYTATWTKNEENKDDSGNDNQGGNNNGNNGNNGSTNNDSNSGTSDNGSDDTATATGSLSLKNVVTGTGANLSKKFQFKIGVLNNGSGVNATYNCTGVSSGKLTFKNGYTTVKLANNEEITISGIPKGYTVTIDQTAVKGYTTKPSSLHAEGTMTSGKLTATFTNTKSSSSDSTTDSTNNKNTTTNGSATLTFEHVTTGDKAEQDKKFAYTLTMMNGSTPVTGSYTYTGTGNGTVAFSSEGKISFTMKNGQTLKLQGLPTGTTYTVTKNDPSDGYTLTKSREDGSFMT